LRLRLATGWLRYGWPTPTGGTGGHRPAGCRDGLGRFLGPGLIRPM